MRWCWLGPLAQLTKAGGSDALTVHPCSDADIKRYIDTAVEVDPERPVLVDKYLDRADELDVDALCDREGNVVICGIMQHIEQAGVHSGTPCPTIGRARIQLTLLQHLCLAPRASLCNFWQTRCLSHHSCSVQL